MRKRHFLLPNQVLPPCHQMSMALGTAERDLLCAIPSALSRAALNSRTRLMLTVGRERTASPGLLYETPRFLTATFKVSWGLELA